MTKRKKIDTSRSCPLYPVGQGDAKLRFAGFAGTRKPAVCLSPEGCPPDSDYPEYHQVIQVRRKPKVQPFTSSCEIFDYFKSLKYKSAEAMYAVGLDNKNRVTVINKVSDGGLNETLLDQRTLFAPLLAAGSARFVLVHNHPSGDPRPSPEDNAVTKRAQEAGKILGMALIDHLVIGDDQYVSLRDAGAIRDN